nr:CRISPR-associated helicase Cas3' [Tepidimonas alkaliphilus]
MPRAKRAWGKWRDAQQWLSLAEHCLDVAHVFHALAVQPSWQKRLQAACGHKLTDSCLERLAVVAFLHDFGKANGGFQAKADPTARDTAGHVMEAAAWLTACQRLWPPAWSRLMTEIATWFRDETQALQMLLASISHHGRPVSEQNIESFLNGSAGSQSDKLWQPSGAYNPLAALDELTQTACEAFPRAFQNDAPAINATPALQQRFAGLVMLADWVASDIQFFPYPTPAGCSRQAFSFRAARHALQATGLIPPQPRTPSSFAEIFGFNPTALQSALATEIAPGEDSRLLLVESDTGSGKTEAALAWFFRLYAEGWVDGLYFALPTRVAARELYSRVHRAIEAAFEPDQRPRPVLLAVPGYVKADGHSVAHLLTDPQGALWDDHPQDLRRERLWAAEQPKRFLAAPIAVGTMDQALLSALQVKHSLLRSVCLDRHLLVVDEVHASDPYMREVLQALLRGHVARGGWALLLSATLGEAAAAAFFDRPLAPLVDAQQRPYPLLTTRTQALPMPASRHRRIQVACSPTLQDDAALIPDIIGALEQGARVLVICNTVKRANALFRSVEAMLQQERPALLEALFSLDGVRCPHHGRFARTDRERLDAAVTARLGKGSPAGPLLLIGTQTLEQSLDIDADWLITDLAPMDVLIQRFGRLHRHARSNRPAALAEPRALVRVPPRGLDAYIARDGSLRAPAGLGTVYADGRVLTLTWQSLVSDPELALPHQARCRIETATHPESFARLPDPWPAHGRTIEGKELSDIRQALRSVLEEKSFGELHYADTGERILTRLGEPTFDIPLAEPMHSPFGTLIDRITIPAHWIADASAPDAIEATAMPEGFRFSVGQTAFRYTRLGLERDDA